MLVKGGVVNEPVIPLPPPPDETHEALLVDNQVTRVVWPLGMEDGDAESVTVGAAAEATVTVLVGLVAFPPGPVHITV